MGGTGYTKTHKAGILYREEEKLMDSDQGPRRGEQENQGATRERSNWWLLLLLVPFVGLLYPPFYARLEPELWGFPFFIWYQFLWVFIGVAVTALVYKIRG
jgi:hypothetical protein